MNKETLYLLLFITFLLFVFILGVKLGSFYGSKALPCVSVEDTYELWGFK